MSNLSN